MIEGIDVNQRIEFVSSFDKTEPKTKFILKPLSGIERMNTIKNGRFCVLTALTSSIVEIQNNKNMDIAEYVNTLPIEIINELVGKINELSDLKDDDKKN